jgi:hypothetical protein
MTYPKLKYPINTKGLTADERNQLLAYDCIYRSRIMMIKLLGSVTEWSDQVKLQELEHDIEANLANLGHFIEETLCKGNTAIYFEGFEVKQTEPVGVEILR